MRIISFSEVRFVRAILEGKKTQTIRPLWTTAKLVFNPIRKQSRWEKHTCRKISKHFNKEVLSQFTKKPIHKVGDKVKLVYKQRVLKKDEIFCSICGKCPHPSKEIKPVIDMCEQCGADLYPGGDGHHLRKHFATANITDVFEIEMGRLAPIETVVAGTIHIKGYGMMGGNGKPLNIPADQEEMRLMAYADGFTKSPKESSKPMFQWFDKRYDLSVPKRFAVNRFKVI